MAGTAARKQAARKLIVCCDGTWNRRDSMTAATNVAKMARALKTFDDSGGSQLIYYHPGVGTGNRVDQFLGGTFGVGLSDNIASAYAFLADNFNYGDQIFLFGFSRGAYTARSLAGLIGLVGLMEKIDMDLFPQVYRIYRSRKYREPIFRGESAAVARAGLRALFPDGESTGQNEKLLRAIDNSRRTTIQFIGIWDTVGSLGVPYGPLRWLAASCFNFHDTELSERINYAYHALAIDERRGPFRPTLWTRPAGRGALPEDQAHRQVLEQVWFAGCHSNVGGGYRDTGLSDLAFLWMASKAASAAADGGAPLAFDAEFLKEKLDSAMGELVDSAGGFWRILPKSVRHIRAGTPPGKETCQFIHWSAVERYQHAAPGHFTPFPYRPKHARAMLGGAASIATVPVSEFEKTHRLRQPPSMPSEGPS